MLQGIDLNQVKQYNASLKQYKDKAASLNAEIEYTNKEIDALCAELTTELGVQVTRDNINQIYDEQVNKINSILQSGNAVLAKIASEEQAAQQPQVQQVAPQPVPQSVPQQPQMQSATVTQVVTPETPVAGSVFGNAQAASGSLPTLFSL